MHIQVHKHIHTHTLRTYIRTHICTHTHTHTQHICASIHTLTHCAHTYARARAHTHTHTSRKHTHTHTHTHTQLCEDNTLRVDAAIAIDGQGGAKNGSRSAKNGSRKLPLTIRLGLDLGEEEQNSQEELRTKTNSAFHSNPNNTLHHGPCILDPTPDRSTLAPNPKPQTPKPISYARNPRLSAKS